MIAIKDMEMPKTCTMCWLSLICKVHSEKPEWMGYNTRMDGCPLVEIVTCADCKHWDGDDCETFCSELGIFGTDPNSFCSYAKRKEE